MEREYKTQAKLFITPTMSGHTGLVSLDYDDYTKLLAVGLMDEEVDVEFEKADIGREYDQGAPHHAARAGLYTILVDGMNNKPQMDIDNAVVDELLARGFKDGCLMNITIKGLPYHQPREADYSDIKMDLDV